MDKRNERYVMQQILYKGKSHGSHGPQTFIITPKLLTDFPWVMISSLIVDLMMELLFILSSKDSIYLLVLVGIQWCVIIEIKEGGDHYRTKKNLHQSVIELMKTVKQNRSLITVWNKHIYWGGCGFHFNLVGSQRVWGILVVLK